MRKQLWMCWLYLCRPGREWSSTKMAVQTLHHSEQTSHKAVVSEQARLPLAIKAAGETCTQNLAPGLRILFAQGRNCA